LILNGEEVGACSWLEVLKGFYMRRLRDDLIYIRHPPAGEVGGIDNDAGVGIEGAGTTDSNSAD